MIFKLPHQKQKAISFIERLDKEMICEIRKETRTRSQMQNRYYWFLLTILQNETGNDKDSLHHYFKFKYLWEEGSISRISKHYKTAFNEAFDFAKSTTKLTTLEMEDYLEKIRVFASRELGCFLPLPHESEFDYAGVK